MTPLDELRAMLDTLSPSERVRFAHLALSELENPRDWAVTEPSPQSELKLLDPLSNSPRAPEDPEYREALTAVLAHLHGR